jgi:hypothetical protein
MKAAFGDFTQETGRPIAQHNMAVTFEMPTGAGASSTVQALLTFNPQACEQLSLCAHSAWQTLPEPGGLISLFKNASKDLLRLFLIF